MPTRPLPRALLLLALASSLGAAPTAVVTADNLLDHEAQWPYRTALTGAWQPPGRNEPLPAGTDGVLIRVEPGQLARIDFAREGKYEVPIAKTDLVENANRIQRGELEKPTPNFVTAFAMKLLDPASDPPRSLRPEQLAERSRFLCVFADATSENIAKLAAALRPLAKRGDVTTILFQQRGYSDEEVLKRLRAGDWLVPFVFKHLAVPYTATLLREGTPMPYVMLMTDEGRVLFEGAWQPNTTARLASALDAESSNK